MLSIEETLEKALNLSFDDKLSWVCIGREGVDPKYLIFDENSKYPKYVVQFGNINDLKRTYKNLVALWELLPFKVPKPLYCNFLDNENKGMLIQTGVSGVPWYSLREEITTFKKWQILQDRSIEALNSFHSAICKNLAWSRMTNPSEELKSISKEYKHITKEHLPVNFDQVIRQRSEELSGLDVLSCHFQHGDFCINNMLISKSQVVIIDFEFFGGAYMPFQDEFLLFSSLVNFAPDPTRIDFPGLWEKISENCQYNSTISHEYIAGFYLYYLLWWGVKTSKNVLRNSSRIVYRALLENYCSLESKNSSWRITDYFTTSR